MIRYVDTDEPGIRRTGHARFRYTDECAGTPVRDQAIRDRIAAIVIPPAWTDVWICADADGHIQATGRDARGRKQYRYHRGFRAEREQHKFADLLPFGEALPRLRAQVDADLDRRGLPFERVVALVVALLERTFVRIGNEEYAADNGTFGLTTLRRRHVVIDRGEITLQFVSKGGKPRRVSCADPRLCRLVRRCQDLRGQLLFQYRDDEDTLSPVSSHDVNDYVRGATGLDATAKTFRTWGGTLLAAAALAALPPPPSQRQRDKALKAVVERVADELGNTPAVCRASYLHPTVIASFEDGSLADRWAAGPARDRAHLLSEERRLLALLAGRRTRRRAAA